VLTLTCPRISHLDFVPRAVITVLLVSGCKYDPRIQPLMIATAPPQPFQQFASPVPTLPAMQPEPDRPGQSFGDVVAELDPSSGMRLAGSLGGGVGVMALAGALLWRRMASGKQLRFQAVECQSAKLVVGLIAGVVGLVLGAVGIGLFLFGGAESSAGAPTLIGIVHGLELMIVAGIFMIGAVALLYASYKAIEASGCLG